MLAVSNSLAAGYVVFGVERTVAAIGKIAVKVYDVVYRVTGNLKINYRGKTGCYGDLLISVVHVDAVGVSAVNVGCVGILVVGVVGRNTEDVVVGVFCPRDNGSFTVESYVSGVLVIGVHLSVNDCGNLADACILKLAGDCNTLQ